MVNPSNFHKIDDSIRTKGGSNRVILVLNPTDIEHWIYKMFYEKGQRDDTTYIHTSYLDNIDNLADSFIRKAEQTKIEDPEFYRHNYLGEFSTIQDRVFKKGYSTFSEIPEDFNWFALGGDWGFADHPTALTAIWKRDRDIYLKEIIYENSLTNQQIADIIKAHGYEKRFFGLGQRRDEIGNRAKE